MAEASRIAWTRSTFNPWIGCTKVSPGCDHCYASVSTPARSLGVKWGSGEPRRRTSEANWKLPLRWDKQAATTGEFWPVFCSSLADVFDNEVDPEWRADLFRLILATPRLTWLLLTKRIGNVATMLHADQWEHLGNVWLGITVVNQEEADRDIPKLLRVPAAKRFLSIEPMLGAINFRWTDWAHRATGESYGNYLTRNGSVNEYEGLRGISWIIVGGESDQPGMKARPFDVQWARSTVRQCKAAGVPVFVKQIGSAPRNWCVALVHADDQSEYDPDHCDNYEAGEQRDCRTASIARCVYLEDRAGADPAEWPEDLRVQQFPAA